MNNRKGFTLVELLGAIVILGIITSMAWPAIKRVQEDNAMQKYTYYGKALIAETKIFIDSYEDDYFKYDSELNEREKRCGQCVTIEIRKLMDTNLAKDINIDGMSCNTSSTFVRVIKKDSKYKYAYYLGCGKLNTSDGSVDASLFLPDEEATSNDRAEACSEVTSCT